MRVFMKRTTEMTIANGEDLVLAGAPIPPGGKLNNVWMDCHIIGPEATQIGQACLYGIGGYVMPLPDGDSALNFDVLWDNLVPKDVDEAQGAFDLDTAATDTTPEFEIGEIDWNAVFEMQALKPIEIFKRRKMLTLATSSVGYSTVDAGTDLYTPVDHFSTHLKRSVKVGSPSLVLFGFSSPDTLQSVSAQFTSPTEQQWVMLTYLEMALEDAFKNLIGLVEAGAETPYDEMSAFVAALIEPSIFEQDAGSFVGVTYTVFTRTVFDITVPGTMLMKTLTSD